MVKSDRVCQRRRYFGEENAGFMRYFTENRIQGRDEVHFQEAVLHAARAMAA